MPEDVRTLATHILDRIEIRHGIDEGLRRRLLPIVTRILELDPPSPERTGLLRLVVRAYARHMEVRRTIEELAERLRTRINARYAEALGIEPPNIP